MNIRNGSSLPCFSFLVSHPANFCNLLLGNIISDPQGVPSAFQIPDTCSKFACSIFIIVRRSAQIRKICIAQAVKNILSPVNFHRLNAVGMMPDYKIRPCVNQPMARLFLAFIVPGAFLPAPMNVYNYYISRFYPPPDKFSRLFEFVLWRELHSRALPGTCPAGNHNRNIPEKQFSCPPEK